MYKFRKSNSTTWVWEDLEVVEIRLTKENRYTLVVVNKNNHLEYTVLNSLLAASLEEAIEESTVKLKEYNRSTLLRMY